MSTGKRVMSRRGGFVWLITAILVALAWGSPMASWAAWLASWTIVGAAWVTVQTIQRQIGARQLVGAISAFASTMCLTWITGYFIKKYAILVAFGPPNSILLCVVLSLLLSLGASLWLISAFIPRAARGSNANPLRLLAKSWGQLKTDKGIWSPALLTGAAHIAAVTVGNSSSALIQVIVGLGAAYTQLFMYSQADRAITYAAVSDELTAMNKRRGWQLARKTLIVSHILFFLFYFFLFTIGEWGWKALLYYPLAVAMGAFYALLAWLIARVKVIYFLVLLLIMLANAVLLGIMIALFWDRI